MFSSESYICFFNEKHLTYVRRRCLGSRAKMNTLLKQKHKFEQQEITSITVLDECHLYGYKSFLKTKLCFRNFAKFQRDNEIDNSNIRDKTTNIY